MRSLIIAVLIELLGSPTWETREVSHLVLSKTECLRELETSLTNPDPEIRRRVRTLLEDAHRVGPLPLPWVDMLDPEWPDRQAVISRCLDRAGWLQDYSLGAPDWPRYRCATLHLIADLLERGWPRWRIERLLIQMVAAEKEYVKKHLSTTRTPGASP